MAILGGSPLGLIGLKSVPTNGVSTFNNGTSRNVVVSEYNRSQAGTLFSGKRRLRAWPNIDKSFAKSKSGKEEGRQDTTGLSDAYMDPEKKKWVDKYVSPLKENSTGSNLLHNNDVYDTSILNILEKLTGTKAELKATDFAYLKYLGVYPNNRLIVARRFPQPSGDNIMVKKRGKEVPSIATLITWVPEGQESFVEVSFGEEWVAAKADFTGMLNSLGEDFGKTGLGKIAGAAGNVLPLPGFTEIFQRQFLKSLELLESDDSIPAGNPNLIKEAKVRKTVGYGEAASGLTAKISIKMTCEYELKFISGIDPTIVWMDLIGMILRFGTSESSNYGLSKDVAAKLGSWAEDPYKMLTDVISGIQEALKNAFEDLKAKLVEAFDEATVAASEMTNDDGKSDGDVATEAAQKAYDFGLDLAEKLRDIGKDVVAASVMKYRVEMMGIVNALTGNPSTPWHVTVGNPLRPVFCSGDMYTTEVTLKLGPELAFNDLPSSIIAEFTLANARPLGLQEIMAKFNSGYLRTVDVQKTFFETKAYSDKNGTIQHEEPAALPDGGLQALNLPKDPVPDVNQGGGNTQTGSTASNTTSNPTGSTASNATNTSPTLVENVPGANSGSTASTTSGDQTKLVGGQK
jgi:hypothetical protein